MRKAFLLCLLASTLTGNALGQQANSFRSFADLDREITLLLLDKDLTELSNQFAQERTNSFPQLLRHLAVFTRAQQPARVRATLEQLVATPNWDCGRAWDTNQFIQTAMSNDLRLRRLYYERLCPRDTNGAESFVSLWEKEGDLKELDSWLAARAVANDQWWINDQWLMQRVYLRQRLGTVNEIIDALASDLRANPRDERRLERYLRIAPYGPQNVAWVADIYEMKLAFDYFKLGSRLVHEAPATAVPLLQKSLQIPFTDQDAKLTADLFSWGRSVMPAIKVNWEKQLRYWAKLDLVTCYRALNQPLQAQPLVEELVNIKGDDIERRDVHTMAGAVQAASGQRVVETKILQDEVARRATKAYWLERTAYYDGRGEYKLEAESFREALRAIPNNPRDSNSAWDRLEVVEAFCFFLARYGEDADARHQELEELMRREFTSAPPDSIYAFRVALRLLGQNEFEVDALRISLLTKQPALVAKIFAGRKEWEHDEERLIEQLVEGDEVTPEQKAKIWSELERLVNHPGSTRAYTLAQALIGEKEWARVIPLLEGYVQNAPSSDPDGYHASAVDDLFDAYNHTGDWQKAEKLLRSRKELSEGSYSQRLGRIAVAAAQQGAPNEAMRLWRLSSNLDRRQLEALPELARAGVKPQLLAMYSQMKKDDPQSSAPDLALRLLQ